MGRHAYTPEQNAWLRERFPTMTNRELAAVFAERFGEEVTPCAMNSWGGNHGVRKEPWVRAQASRKYTDEQLDFLREVIPGRSLSEVNDLYEERFGARLTRAALCGLRTKLGVYCGVNAGRFRKGQEPPNKGKTWDEMGISQESRERMLRTSFKCGQLPHNTRPLLDVRTVGNMGGETREIHVGLNRRKRANDQWIPLAQFNWMQANGRDWPEGHRALHIDHDPLNDDADNIEPVPTELWPLVMGAVPGQLEWHDRETLRAAILYARLTRARVDAERRARIAAGRPRKGDLRDAKDETE
jgi:hypothetical protein